MGSAGAFQLPGIHGVESWARGPGVFLGASTSVKQPSSIPDPFTLTQGGMNHGESANTQGSRPIPFKVPIATNPITSEQSFITSEPMFFIKQQNEHTLKKTFSLKQMNAELLRQHGLLLGALEAPGKRKEYRRGQRPTIFYTEENFTQHVGFGGLISPAGAGGATESSSSNPGKTSRMLAMLGKGDIEAANVWGSGLIDVPVRPGSTLGFCLKRKNQIDSTLFLGKHTARDLLMLLGPLELSPIGATQKYGYSNGTMKNEMSLLSFTRRMYNAGKLDKESGEYLTTEDEKFDGFIHDNWHIDGFSRGRMYYTFPRLLEYIEGRGKTPFPKPLLTCGIVFEVGIANEVNTSLPHQDFVVEACTDVNSEHCSYKKTTLARGGDRNGAHMDLQKEHFLKLFVYLDQGQFHLDVESLTEVTDMGILND